MMRRIKGKKIVMIILCLVLTSGLAYAYGIYHGHITLNRPSMREYPVRGIDVSHYQGIIDWNLTADHNNLTFAYIKATEGSAHIDDMFAVNWEQAAQTSLKIGAYHFFSFDSQGETQLQNYVSQVKEVDGMLPPAVDVEFYGDKKENLPDPEVVRAQLKVMLDGLEKTYHMTPVIYATEESWRMFLEGEFDDYPLWIRNVVTKPHIGEASWAFWQYTNRGLVKGIGSEPEPFTDINVFHGDYNEFISLDWAK